MLERYFKLLTIISENVQQFQQILKMKYIELKLNWNKIELK